MKSIARSSKDIRTGEQYSRTIDRTATVKPRLFGGTTVKLNRNVTNYKDMPGGGRKAVTTQNTGYKKVYSANGTLKKTKTY